MENKNKSNYNETNFLSQIINIKRFFSKYENNYNKLLFKEN